MKGKPNVRMLTLDRDDFSGCIHKDFFDGILENCGIKNTKGINQITLWVDSYDYYEDNEKEAI